MGIGESTARKGPIGSTNHQWGMKKTTLMEVSLYPTLTGSKIPTLRFSRKKRRWA